MSEDGQAASFAGQYDTYLGVSGPADVLLHVRRCWASGFSAPALAYRRRLGGTDPAGAADLAVGVLELVDARSAGVAFTLDPITGDRGVCVVEGNWGFGESVVSGQVTPDHWTVDRATGQVLAARTGAKTTWAAPVLPQGRVVLSPLPAELAGQRCLSRGGGALHLRAAAAIEAAEDGTPQDVEWAVARGLPFPDSVYLLQHRPETTWARRRTRPAEADPPPERSRPPSTRSRTRCATSSGCPAHDRRDPRRGGRGGGRPGRRRGARQHARDDGDLEVGYKDARANLVTAADRESQAGGRRESSPPSPVTPSTARRARRGTWTPRTSGTSTRSTARPTSPTACRSSAFPSPSAAVATVAGAVYDPLHDEMFWRRSAAGRP